MMNKKILMTFLCSMFCLANIVAQLPEASTGEDPLWYFIQVKGEGERAGRVLTAKENGDIYGSEMPDRNNVSARDSSLWRFQKEGDNAYFIVHKTTGKKMITRIASEIETNLAIATLSDSNTETWQFPEHNDGYQIKSSGALFAHQADTYGKRNYVTMFVTESSGWQRTDNSIYNFIPYNNEVPKVSGDEEYWYYMLSAMPEWHNKCITDISASLDETIKFELRDRRQGITTQQWKLIQPVNASGEIYFVNRHTNNLIKTEYIFDKYYHAQSGKETTEFSGWQISFIDYNQFAIFGYNEESLLGYLNVSSDLREVQDVPSSLSLIGSSYAWYFIKELDPGMVSIEEKQKDDPFEGVSIYTENKKIIVEGASEYSVVGLSGIMYDKDQQLADGIYFVTIKGKSLAVVVR